MACLGVVSGVLGPMLGKPCPVCLVLKRKVEERTLR